MSLYYESRQFLLEEKRGADSGRSARFTVEGNTLELSKVFYSR